MSRLSPRSMARQTLAIFSSHDPDDTMSKLSTEEIEELCRFFQGRLSRRGALTDGTHTVGTDLLKMVRQPTPVIHRREDNSVPFAHAEWSLKHIPHADLCEASFTGQFFWIGPDFLRISQRMVAFLQEKSQWSDNRGRACIHHQPDGCGGQKPHPSMSLTTYPLEA